MKKGFLNAEKQRILGLENELNKILNIKKDTLQNREIQKKTLSHYTYNNLNFDSSWELAVYIYCIDNNICINRLPTKFT